jgi:hypothetical protein
MSDKFELQLQKAMLRVDAPETLLRSVMAAVESQAPQRVYKPSWRERLQFVLPQPRIWATGARAALAVVALGGQQWHRHQQRELATQQFETASRITDRAMEHTRQQLARAGVPLD